jgi:hypothetical protein
MTNKITLGLVGVVLIISVYNAVNISNIKIENVIEQPNRSNTVNTNAVPQQSNIAANPSMENLNTQSSNPNTITPAQQNPGQTQTASSGPTTSIQFKNEVHDFGNVDVETENSYAFEFTNTGTEPLTITNARGSCGCTVPDWPKQAIKPNETATIDVIFRPSKGQAGVAQEKTVTVEANTEPKNTIVKIKAFVNAEK